MKNPPKNFLKYASSPDLAGIQKSAKSFYCNDNLIFAPPEEGITYIFNKEKKLSLVILETSRGFYLGEFKSKEEKI